LRSNGGSHELFQGNDLRNTNFYDYVGYYRAYCMVAIMTPELKQTAIQLLKEGKTYRQISIEIGREWTIRERHEFGFDNNDEFIQYLSDYIESWK
jgi:hypothetical protein